MPGFETHYFFGVEAMSVFPKTLQSNIKAHPKAYQIGLQGPDIFFYCIPAYLLGKQNIGNYMHNHDVWAFFDACCTTRNRLTELPARQIIDAYLLGFISHYTLDTICHPYVYYRTKHLTHTERKSYDFGIHVALETDIDNALTRHYAHLEPSEFQPWKTIHLTTFEYVVIRDFLFQALMLVYPNYDISKFIIGNALKSMELGQRLLHDPTKNKKFVVRWIEGKLFSHAVISSMIPSDTLRRYKDPLNLRHKLWKNPWDPSFESNEDIFQLISRAQQEMARRGKLYQDAFLTEASNYRHPNLGSISNLLEDLSDCSYLSGLPLS